MFLYLLEIKIIIEDVNLGWLNFQARRNKQFWTERTNIYFDSSEWNSDPSDDITSALRVARAERLLVQGVYSGHGEQNQLGLLTFNLPIASCFSLHHQVAMHLGS